VDGDLTDGSPTRACGCASTDARFVAIGPALLGLLFLRRRRRG
jgi:MYXO-CTERM domain-containing protein